MTLEVSTVIMTDCDKLYELNKILWHTEKELLEAKNQLVEKDGVIKDLQDELYVSDLEVKELREILENAHNVKFIHDMLLQIKELSRMINELKADICMNELELKDMRSMMELSADASYLKELNDRNDKLMKINRYLMENIYKSKVIYM